MSAEPTYPPRAFRETRRETIVGFIRAAGFGHLISAGGGVPHATGVPFLVRDEAGSLVLEAHLHRGNPQWRALGSEVLALFQGPHAYVHPGWYPTKREDGRAVPTWNYITVQARGRAEAFEADAGWLRAHVAALSAAHEAGRPDPWSIDDAPGDYIATMLRGIVGVRLTVRELDGRWKLSQNHPEANRRGVMEGLAASESAGASAVLAAMAGLEAERAR
jgi:transcriptional regulator